MAVTIKLASNNNGSGMGNDKLGTKPLRINETTEITVTNHNKLLDYGLARVDAGYQMHEANYERYKSIDKEIAGYLVLSDEDRKRKADNEKGFGTKPYDINLQLTYTQIDEAITYLMAVYFPSEGAYTATASADKLAIAKGLSVLMNQHAKQYKHYTSTAKGLLDAFKYNIGMWMPEWNVTSGTEIGNDSANQYQETLDSILATGNSLTYLDPYNTILDPSVHPTVVNSLGEFFASVEIYTEFRAKKLEHMGLLFNLDKRNQSRAGGRTYYQIKPNILANTAKGASGENTDWISFLSAQGGGNILIKDSIELLGINIWLTNENFGLPGEGMQIWRVVIANSSVIVFAEPLVNAHGLLPIIAAMPREDNFDRQTQSIAEVLLPYQRFSSFQMNIHQHAQRKNLHGLTFYDKVAFPEFANADASGKIPFTPDDPDFDVRKHVQQFFDSPNTDRTLQDIAAMDELMQKVLPTQQAQQVASLERATKFQAAATVQAGNRRNLKFAATIDEQAFSVGRRIMLYNIMQFQENVMIVTPEGEEVEIEPSEIRDTKFEFMVDSGLRGLDKLAIQDTLTNIMFAILQSPTVSQQIDVLALMNYITNQMGDYTNLNQFKFKNEFDALTPEQKQQAFQLLQGALQQQGIDNNPNVPDADT